MYLSHYHIVRELRLAVILFFRVYDLMGTFVLKRIYTGIMIPTRWRLLLGANKVHALYVCCLLEKVLIT